MYVVESTCFLELIGPDGEVKYREEGHNLITQVGDQMYAERGAGIMTLAAPTGMRLGIQATPTAPSKTGTGAALQAYLAGSSVGFMQTPQPYPTSQLSGAARIITYRCEWPAGVATTGSAITEVVLVNGTIATQPTSGASNGTAETIARYLVTGVGSKNAADILAFNWTSTFQGTA
jgi:hypothetical protein